MLNLQKYFNELIKNVLFGWKTWGRWLLWLKISCVQTFCFFSSNVATFPTSRKCKNLNFSLHTVPVRNAISSKVFKEFSKTIFWLKDDEGGYCGWKFQEHRHFAFAIATLPLFQHPENVIISIFPFTLSQQKCWYPQKYFNEFSKTFYSPERLGSGDFVENFKCTDILVLPVATLPLFQHPENVKISISPFTMSHQKCYIFKSF